MGMYCHRRNGMADERKHPPPDKLATWMRSGARWFVGDLGRSQIDEHKRLGQVPLRYWRKDCQLDKAGDCYDVATGSAHAAFVKDRRLGTAFCISRALDPDFITFDVVGFAAMLSRIIGSRGLKAWKRRDLRSCMVRPWSAKAH